MEELREYTPQEYFDYVKDKKQHITDEVLTGIYENCLSLIEKYKVTGQRKGLKKLIFHLECIEKEREIIKLGIDTFIYRDDIEEYIDSIAKDTVKIIELENYERDIPDEIVSVIEAVKDKFDKLYVVFTDYTGKVERTVEKERRSIDPILFGTFQNELSRTVIDRFYFLGDWEDEYCDLTLDKMVNEIKSKKDEDVSHYIKSPINLEELKNQLSMLEENDDRFIVAKKNKKQSFFKKVKSIITGK